MSNPINLSPALIAQIEEVSATVPPEHRVMLEDGSIVSSIESAVDHINDWSFLNGHAYVVVTASERERRWRYNCIFHSRAVGQSTKNSRKIAEKDRVRVKTHTRGMGCPVGISITR